MISGIKQFIKEYHMLDGVTDIVTGVSGGADSTALLLALNELREEYGFSIHVVHINHMIRGSEADRDEAFVKQLAEGLGIPFHVFRKDIPGMAEELSLTEEEAGRIFRYECFEGMVDAILREKGQSQVRIAVAHNRDDLAETVLFNEARGSSLRGLGGMKPVRGNIIRPLLFTWRVDIEKYLTELGQDWVTDSTNLETEYSRNRIRQIILPEMEKLNPGVKEHLTAIARDSWELYDGVDKENEMLLNSLTESSDKSRTDIPVGMLKKLNTFARKEFILEILGRAAGRRKDITRRHIDSVEALVDAESGKSVNLPYGLLAEKGYGVVIIRKVTAGESHRTDAKSGIGKMDIKVVPKTPELQISKEIYTKMVDYDKIEGDLVLRMPEDGDYIVISRTGGRKSLKRLFTDLKIERDKRQFIPVVAAEGSHEIIWVVGHRLSESFKIDEDTTRVCCISYER